MRKAVPNQNASTVGVGAVKVRYKERSANPWAITFRGFLIILKYNKVQSFRL